MMNRENLKTILLDIRQTMRDADLEFFLLHGTLLGYYRDKDIIPWDDDIDLGCRLPSDENYEIANKIVELFKNKGYVSGCYVKKTNEWSGACNVVMTTTVDDVFVKQGNLTNDKLSFAFKFIKRIADRAVEASSPVSYDWNDINNLEQVNFLGDKFHIPAKPENLFDIWYGKDCWQIPSRRAWIVKSSEPIKMYENQAMGFKAGNVVEALLKCDKDGKYIEPYVKTGQTPRNS